MQIPKRTTIALAACCCVVVGTSNARAQVCAPAPGGAGCTVVACSTSAAEQCSPEVLHLDVTTGAIRTIACACRDPLFCHIEFGGASPIAIGACPDGRGCQVMANDTDGDGVDDVFAAACVPVPVGVCCLDITDGLVPFETCVQTDSAACAADGGLFHEAPVGCDEVQACCIPLAIGGLCEALHPACCIASGGVPLGPGSTCANLPDVVCPQVCGGIAGIPCSAADQFCRFPDGACCCDIMGVCLRKPIDCPLVWDPVCGCDGVTYSNECEAFMAGVSIDHRGECNIGACCVSDPAGNKTCVIAPADVCAAEGGFYFGDGTTCPPDSTLPCGPPRGACCVTTPGAPAPVCVETTEAECAGAGGQFAGNGTRCPPDGSALCASETVACCFPGGFCADLPLGLCLLSHGTPGAPGGDCTVTDCANLPTGACCLTDPTTGGAICEIGTQALCLFFGGDYLGDGTTCDSSVCGPAPEGACCLLDAAGTPTCFVASAERCALEGGAYQGDGSSCVNDPSVPCAVATGACCVSLPGAPIRVCIDTTAEKCAVAGGDYRGDGTACPSDGSVLCGPGTVACCFDNGECADLPLEVCVVNGGHPGGPDTACGLFDCANEPTGACCIASPTGVPFCFVGTGGACLALGGAFQGDSTTCEPNPCGTPPEGACCVVDAAGNRVCVVTTEFHCVAENGHYQGDGTVCPVDPTSLCGPPTGACCLTSPIDAAPHCEEIPEVVCRGLGGTYLGDATTCPADPALACPRPCPILCGPAFDCFRGCGILVQDGDCVLFKSDDGRTLVPSDIGAFAVGDRVVIEGCLDPSCTTTCNATSGCIHVAGIDRCGDVCGGIAGIPCNNPDEFCKFPPGTCNMADIFGLCAPIPGACPDIFDPVCGCDGVTYANRCEADRAGVSIDHPGECLGSDCAAARGLSEPTPAYCPGVPKRIVIRLGVPAGATVIGLEDAPPADWTVVHVSHEGTFDAVNGKVKWGPLFAPFPPFVFYDAVPSESSSGDACFEGTISVDGGVNLSICGDACVGVQCRPFMPADLPQPACPICPVGDCTTCGERSCGNGAISLCEVIGYACAWLAGCHDDLAGMARAAFIWKNGECYCFNETEQNWFPTDCPAPPSGFCAASGAESVPGLPSAMAAHTETAVVAQQRNAIRDRRPTVRAVVKVPVAIEPPAGTSATALEISVPEGWDVVDISDNGEWDARNRKVKWGPVYGDTPFTVALTARPIPDTKTDRKRRSSAPSRARFSGTVSFDGINFPIDFQ